MRRTPALCSVMTLTLCWLVGVVQPTGGAEPQIPASMPASAPALKAFSAAPAPTVTGVPRVGSTLTAHTAGWSPAPRRAFQWLRDGTPIAHATGRSYTLVRRDLGHRIAVRLTATRAGYLTKVRRSPRTAAIRPRPVIVLDPGHSPAVHRIDPATRLDVSEYENEPEMRNVYDVALRVRKQLRRDGYTVVLTKASVTTRVNLAKRAQIANRAHADLAVSIHDQAGAYGGIGYRAGNNIVYYQSVGGYRTNVDGRRIVFTDKSVAALSKKYARTFRSVRRTTQRATVRVQGGTGYDLGGRGLAAGDMWMVQLLATVPWVYNEAGGNSAGRVGLTAADRANYAAALAGSIEACVPLTPAP